MNLKDEVQMMAHEMLRSHLDWRPGQAAFNALYQINRTAADLIRGQHDDPFYDDANLPSFWEHLDAWDWSTWTFRE